MFDNKKIVVTGGTGTFGKNFCSMTLSKYKPKELIVISRDEMKQWEMQEKFKKFKNITFILADVRDKEKISSVLKGIDFVFHAAATKIVLSSELNPEECIKTNVMGAINVIHAAKVNNVKKVIALSTDKACNPVNLYGASKLASDKLFIAANFQNNSKLTKFSIVRYGNVIGSRGSIIPFFLNIPKNQVFPITDVRMTRFLISINDAVKLVWSVLKDMQGGEIYVKKIPSIKIIDLARVIDPKRRIKIVGIRPGEKLHEEMISLEDAYTTYEFRDYFKILPQINNTFLNKKIIKNGKKVSENFKYKSDLNKDWIKLNKLKKLIFDTPNV
jgi:UDP-N-acetylglucosamine 4,6-dehydratase (inverting)